jgi:hypothetical protein
LGGFWTWRGLHTQKKKKKVKNKKWKRGERVWKKGQ